MEITGRELPENDSEQSTVVGVGPFHQHNKLLIWAIFLVVMMFGISAHSATLVAI